MTKRSSMWFGILYFKWVTQFCPFFKIILDIILPISQKIQDIPKIEKFFKCVTCGNWWSSHVRHCFDIPAQRWMFGVNTKIPRPRRPVFIKSLPLTISLSFVENILHTKWARTMILNNIQMQLSSKFQKRVWIILDNHLFQCPSYQ